jgi:hypothetical protein
MLADGALLLLPMISAHPRGTFGGATGAGARITISLQSAMLFGSTVIEQPGNSVENTTDTLTTDVLVLAVDAASGDHSPHFVGAGNGTTRASADNNRRWRLVVLRVEASSGAAGQIHTQPSSELGEWAASLHTSIEIATAPWL